MTDKIVNNAARQGDVPMVRVESVPDGYVEVPVERGTATAALGEVTGHHHSFTFDPVAEPALVRMYRDTSTGEQMFTIGGGGAPLTHQEHSTIVFSRGTWLQGVQVEDTGEMIQQVAD